MVKKAKAVAEGAATAEDAAEPKSKKKKQQRTNRIFFQKLLKHHGVSAKGDVVDELERMSMFLVDEAIKTSKTITARYTKKVETVKPKLLQAAFQVMLRGDCRNAACESAASAVVDYVEAKRLAAEAATAKKAAPAVSA